MSHSPASSLPQFPCSQQPWGCILGDAPSTPYWLWYLVTSPLVASFHASPEGGGKILSLLIILIASLHIHWVDHFLPHNLSARFRRSEGYALAELELECAPSRWSLSTRQPHKRNFHFKQKHSPLWQQNSSHMQWGYSQVDYILLQYFSLTHSLMWNKKARFAANKVKYEVWNTTNHMKEKEKFSWSDTHNQRT